MSERSRTWRTGGLVLTDHAIDVPWDHADPGGEQIEVFARVVAADDGADRPYLVYLQGGPGQESPRPTAAPASPSWLDRALRDYRVVLLDQRGTGLSTPYGGAPSSDPEVDARWLRRFRADAIVADAELLREHLGVARWSLLGQSFGGFCTVRYLSAAAGSVREAYVTGGLPPVGLATEEIYARTWRRMRTLTARLWETFPGDRERMAAALAAAGRGEVVLPDGTVVSPDRLRGVGNQLGMDGGALAVHYLLERDPRSPAFRSDLAGLLPFAGRNPLYAVLHESSYADGVVTGWSAQRTQPDDDPADLLMGEHLFERHLTEGADLAPYAGVAGVLAHEPWPALYDAGALAAADVPVAAAVYADDPYVDAELSLATADLIPDARTWVTDRYLHNGLRVAGDEVLGHLIALVRSGA